MADKINELKLTTRSTFSKMALTEPQQ